GAGGIDRAAQRGWAVRYAVVERGRRGWPECRLGARVVQPAGARGDAGVARADASGVIGSRRYIASRSAPVLSGFSSSSTIATNASERLAAATMKTRPNAAAVSVDPAAPLAPDSTM